MYCRCDNRLCFANQKSNSLLSTIITSTKWTVSPVLQKSQTFPQSQVRLNARRHSSSNTVRNEIRILLLDTPRNMQPHKGPEPTLNTIFALIDCTIFFSLMMTCLFWPASPHLRVLSCPVLTSLLHILNHSCAYHPRTAQTNNVYLPSPWHITARICLSHVIARSVQVAEPSRLDAPRTWKDDVLCS